MVVFALEGQRVALSVRDVERVVRAVEITPLPKAPEAILGVINIQGRVVPVFNLRRRFRMRERDVALTDLMLVARTTRRSVALVADTVAGVEEWTAQERVPPETIAPGIEYVEGVVKRPDGMIFIHDLDTFLSLEEARQLEEALTP